MCIHLLAQLSRVREGGFQHAGHLAGQESMYGRAQGQPGVQEHAAAGAVMYLHARTRLSSEGVLSDTRQAKRRPTAASQAAKTT